jgi:hypothetical protein
MSRHGFVTLDLRPRTRAREPRGPDMLQAVLDVLHSTFEVERSRGPTFPKGR